MIEINKIYNQDNRTGLTYLPDESIDCTICSPPYKDADGYESNYMQRIFTQIYRVMKNETLLFMNFGHLAGFKRRPFDLASQIESIGFNWEDTICWIKNHFTPLQGNRLNNLTEFIFMFSKGKMPRIDRLSIGVPYSDPSNAKRFNNGSNLRCAGNVWNIKIPTITKKSQRLHPDGYPVELPERCIKLAALQKGSVVLDPWTGAGSTALGAKNLGFNYIGFEINEKYYNIAIERLKIND